MEASSTSQSEQVLALFPDSEITLRPSTQHLTEAPQTHRLSKQSKVD